MNNAPTNPKTTIDCMMKSGQSCDMLSSRFLEKCRGRDVVPDLDKVDRANRRPISSP
jgi:hypothetical protein